MTRQTLLSIAFVLAIAGAPAGAAAPSDALSGQIPVSLEAPTQPQTPPPENAALLDLPAPALDLPDLAGRRVRLEDLRGKPVLLNFWAFWCDTWREEMPYLLELAGRQDDLHFRIVAVSVDGARLPEFSPRATAELPFPVLLDIGGTVTRSYQVEHVPTVILLDAEGRVRYSCVAWPGNQVVLNQLRRLASASDPAAMPPARSAFHAQGGRKSAPTRRTIRRRRPRPPVRAAQHKNVSTRPGV